MKHLLVKIFIVCFLAQTFVSASVQAKTCEELDELPLQVGDENKIKYCSQNGSCMEDGKSCGYIHPDPNDENDPGKCGCVPIQNQVNETKMSHCGKKLARFAKESCRRAFARLKLFISNIDYHSDNFWRG